MRNISHVIFSFLITLFLLSSTAYAVDNLMYEPYCMSPSYDSGYTTLTTSNNATTGQIVSRTIGNDGYFAVGNTRVYDGINILCAVSDPTTVGALVGSQRIFGSSEDGSVWYTDSLSLNYSAGFYNTGYLGCGVDGNCNDLRRIGAQTAQTRKIPMATDSNGNLYTANFLTSTSTIIKYVKSLSYSPQTIYTVPNPRTVRPYVLDIQIDASDNIYLLVGEFRLVGDGATENLNLVIITSSGALISTEAVRSTAMTGDGYGYLAGGLILDATNPAHNFTYTYQFSSVTPGSSIYLLHNSTIGSSDIGGGDLDGLGITSSNDIYYENYQIYLLSPAQNIIRSYVTTFAGQLPGSIGGGTPVELTYSISTINILETSYYNNTPIDVNVNVVVDLSGQSLACDLLNCQNNYRWKMQLNDPNGAQAAFHLSGYCIEVGTSCSMNETLSISPPITNWTTGIYTAYLKEYNVDTYSESTLATDTTNVLNVSGNNTGIAITEPITSGTGTTALGTIDGITGLLGFGINPISKFVFAMILIITFMFFGYIATKLDTMGGIIAASLPFCFFVFISYIPLWTVIIVVLIIAFKGKWVG